MNSPASPAPPRRILAVFNPAAGRTRGAHFARVVEALRRHGCAVTIMETESRGHAETIARAASDETYDVLAAAGGDGTINEIVNGLCGRALALGIIPLGTANVLAREIGLGRSAEAVARTLAFGPVREIHLGRANGRCFVMMAGIGFDANVVSRVSLRLKRRLGPLAYIWQGARQAVTERFEPCHVTIDGTASSAISVVACKGRRYGGPFIAAPGASLNQGQFHVLLMKGQGWFSVLRYGLALVFGRVTVWPDVQLVVGRDIVVSGREGQPVQADGDIVAHLPVHIVIDPSPLRLIYPR